MPTRDEEAVFVEASARLHFGVLDLRGTRGRWFGGIGASAARPTLLVSAAPRRYARGRRRRCRARTRVRASLPRAPQPSRWRPRPRPSLAAAARRSRLRDATGARRRPGAGRALRRGERCPLAGACGRPRQALRDRHMDVRGRRSRRRGRTARGSATSAVRSIARVPFPATWRCVVAIPDGAPGISGAGEAEAFARLPAPPERDVERVAHIVLMALLPALADADLAGFGRALSEVQEITGRWFASVQGGTFAPGASADLVRRLSEWGASGVGQSSWGPAVYGIVEGDEAGRALADRAREAHGLVRDRCSKGRSDPDGARVWRAGRSRNDGRGGSSDPPGRLDETRTRHDRLWRAARRRHSRSHARSISRRSTRARRSAS